MQGPGIRPGKLDAAQPLEGKRSKLTACGRNIRPWGVACSDKRRGVGSAAWGVRAHRAADPGTAPGARSGAQAPEKGVVIAKASELLLYK